jgi:hypothetical protein
MVKVIEFAFVGYSSTDMSRSRAFYEGALNLTPATVFEHEGKSWIEYEVGPHTLAITDMNAEWEAQPGRRRCCLGGRGFRWSDCFAQREGRFILRGAIRVSRLPHGTNRRPGRQHDLHSQTQR